MLSMANVQLEHKEVLWCPYLLLRISERILKTDFQATFDVCSLNIHWLICSNCDFIWKLYIYSLKRYIIFWHFIFFCKLSSSGGASIVFVVVVVVVGVGGGKTFFKWARPSRSIGFDHFVQETAHSFLDFTQSWGGGQMEEGWWGWEVPTPGTTAVILYARCIIH